MKRARIAHLCVSEKKGVQKTEIERISLEVGHGILGDAHAGAWHRQVSILDFRDIEEMRDVGLELAPGAFAENVATIGLPLATLGLGTTLRFGEAVVRISQLGKRCHKPCAISRAAGYCIMPSRGVFARVLSSGKVGRGDAVEILVAVPREDLQAAVVTSDATLALKDCDSLLEDAFHAHLDAHLHLLDIVDLGSGTAAKRVRGLCGGRGIDLVLCDTALDIRASKNESVSNLGTAADRHLGVAKLARSLETFGKADIIGNTLILHDLPIPEIHPFLAKFGAEIREVLLEVREGESSRSSGVGSAP